MTKKTKYVLFSQIILAVVSGVAAVFILADTVAEVRESQTEFRGNLTHYAAQVSYELFQLIDHINRYAQQDAAVTRADLSTRMDILWSRLDETAIGGRGQLFLALPGGAELATQTIATLERIEPDLLSLEREDILGAYALSQELRALIGPSRAVADAAIAFDATQDTQHYTTDLRNSFAVIFVIVAFFVLVIFSLLQSFREISRSSALNAELENRVALRTTELEEANSKLEAEVAERTQTEQRYRTLVDRATEAIVVFDVDAGTFVEANPRAEAMFGLPRDKVIDGYGPHDLSPELQPDQRPSREAAMAYIEEALAGDFPSFEWMHQSIDGMNVPCSVSLARFPDPNRRLIRGSLIDLTEKKTAEASKIELEGRLAQAQKLETIGQMTGGVAHDFNNLLSVIMGNLELLEDYEPDSEQKELIAEAKSASMRGASLTRAMLNFARRAHLQPQQISLSEIVDGMESWMSRTIPATIKVKTSFKSDLWPVIADIAGTESALLNLVINACDAMPEGGLLVIETENVEIHEANAAATVQDLAPGRYVMLAVSDTGHGIPSDEISRVFEPFFTTKGLSTNSGLGLSMVHGFMTQSGGDVRIYSEPKIGTTVKLFFPAQTKGQSTEPGDEDAKQASPAKAARILLAEDQEDVLLVLRRSLEAIGHKVITARSGDEAAKLYAEIERVDLLVTDVVMPGDLQGPALAKQLRQTDPDLPVIFLSGYASEATLHGNGLRKKDVRLMKPVARKKLISAVNVALNERGSTANS